jgi:guanylate kinase
MKPQGSLIIISAPSGTGKTSLVAALTEKLSNLLVSVSHTTRLPRAGEINGVHYNFVNDEQFEQMLKADMFLEHAEVFGNSYGTSRDWVSKTVLAGIDVVLEIDWQGARQIRSQMPEAVSIFILPPSARALQERLTSRNLDDAGVIATRLAQAKNEVSHYNEYEYLIINDDFNKALDDLTTVIAAARLRCSRQKRAREELIAELS